MPLIRSNDKLLFFAHVPKCGGTSVEKALIANKIELSFYDSKFWSNKNAWYKTSPQHITIEQLNRILPASFIDESFALVRDPLKRFQSAYNYNAEKIGWHTSLDKFITKLENSLFKDNDYLSCRFDNHFTPANRLIPGDSKIFFLENGLKELFDWLSIQLNIKLEIDTHVILPRKHKKSRTSKLIDKLSTAIINKPTNQLRLNLGQIDRIQNLYKEDYERFFNSSDTHDKTKIPN